MKTYSLAYTPKLLDKLQTLFVWIIWTFMFNNDADKILHSSENPKLQGKLFAYETSRNIVCTPVHA